MYSFSSQKIYTLNKYVWSQILTQRGPLQLAQLEILTYLLHGAESFLRS